MIEPAEIEKNNQTWWAKHCEGGEYAHRHETPVSVDGDDFPLGQGNKYGPFIYCPLPVSGVTRWGFQRKAGLDLFLADLAAGTLPTGGKKQGGGPISHEAPKAKPAAAPAPAVDTFADLEVDTAPPAADPFDILGEPEPERSASSGPMGDVNADLVADHRGPPAASPDGLPGVGFADLDPEPPTEDEVDEWGEVIKKPGKPDSADDADDPFAGI